MKLVCCLALAVGCCAAAADLAAVKAEANPEKRSEMAAAYAEEALTGAKAAWKQGETKAFETRLNEVRDAVDLCLASLQETGKPPYKMLKWYKHAELKTRELSRRLDAFAEEASLDERPAIQKVNERVQTVHEELLLGVLSRKK